MSVLRGVLYPEVHVNGFQKEAIMSLPNDAYTG